MVQLSQVLPHEVVKKMFLPVIQTLKADKVINIRMNVAQCISQIAPLIKNSGDLEEQMKGILKVLQSDPEYDVKYFAQKSLESFK